MQQIMPLVQLPTGPMPDFIVVHGWKENSKLRADLRLKLSQLEAQLALGARSRSHGSGDLYEWYGLNCLVLILARVLDNPGQRVTLSDLSNELRDDPERSIWAMYHFYRRNPLHEAFRLVSEWVTGKSPLHIDSR